jgi:hypothetical protein
MGGVISTGRTADQVWLVANWAYESFMGHVRDAVSGDPVLEFEIDRATAFQGLSLELLEKDVSRRLVPVLIRVAEQVVAGELPVRVHGGRRIDALMDPQMRSAARELLLLLRSYD